MFPGLRAGLVLALSALLTILSGLLSSAGFARWATREDAGWELVESNREVEVESDGSYTETIETRKRLLKDSARGALTVVREVYNSNIARFELIEAKTVKKGREFPVDPSLIEDKPLASGPKGFDKLHQVLLVFPEVNAGSEVVLKYSLKHKDVPLAGSFAADYVFGWDGVYQTGGRVRISSELPIYLSANDPDEALEIHEIQEIRGDAAKKTGRRSLVEITLKKPVLKKAVDESSTYLNLKNYPWVTVSSFKSWNDAAPQLLPKYEEVLSAPLPKVFEKIAARAALKKTDLEKINEVTARVSALVNYMGDWKTISGRYVPRLLATIAESRLGDCKDFSAATVAILRKLGFQANVALIKRGIGAMEKPTVLPTLYDFNHAIAHVKTDTGEYWVDPTNFTSFAHGIYPDIADRPAWVLDRQGSYVSRTTRPGAENEHSEYSASIEMQPEGAARFEAELRLKGTAAIRMTGARLKASKESVDYSLVSPFADRDQLMDWEVEPYELKSREVRDLDFKFRFSEKRFERKTSNGLAMDLTLSGPVSVFLTKVDNRVSDLFLGTPSVIRRKVRLNSASRIGRKSLDCTIGSPWLNASRKVASVHGGVEVTDEWTVLAGLVANQELRSPEFARFQEQFNQCFWRVSLLYQKKSGQKKSPARQLAKAK
jgi:hypothetical protein